MFGRKQPIRRLNVAPESNRYPQPNGNGGTEPLIARFGRRRRLLRLAGALAFAASILLSGKPPGQAQTLRSHGVLHVQRNEVLVPVVVRDSKGQAITNLDKDNFRLYDNGKLQSIDGFAVERYRGASGGRLPDQAALSARSAGRAVPPAKRYVALYFDDLNLPFGDLARSRAAAERFLPAILKTGVEVGIFTSSGKDEVDFTNDLDDLRQDLRALEPRTRVPLSHQCPDLDPYEAYMIVHAHDPWTTSLVVAETEACLCRVNLLSGGISSSEVFQPRSGKVPLIGAGGPCPEALEYAEGQAEQLLAQVQLQSRYTLDGLEGLIARMDSLEGQKTIVFVSSGFFTMSLRYELSQAVDSAVRTHVTISSLDARGLVPGGIAANDGSDGGGRASLPAALSGRLAELREGNLTSSGVGLATLASATGGLFYHNDNDLEQGFRETGTPARAVYLLSFTPARLIPNGQFHAIRVDLAGGARGTVEARPGYYAPSEMLDAKARAADQIGQAVSSDEDLGEISVFCGAKVPKSGNLSVFTHVDLRPLRFKNERGLNSDDLIVVVALFDRSDRYVTGREQTARMRLSNAQLKKLRQSGVVFRSNLKAKPGDYTLRVVVRDSGSGKMSALSRRIALP